MRIGITIFATDGTWATHEVAAAAEGMGFDSFYLPEHTHIPISRRTPPPTGDKVLAEEYRRSADPLIALAACAMATTTLHLGTGVLLPAQREPIVTAKAIASLENLCPGRLSIGTGFGWNEDEMENHGVDYATRRTQAREHVQAMQQFWYHEVAEYSGRFVDIAPSWSWPKPSAEIPILVGGGAGPRLFEHIVQYGHGWIPIGSTGVAEQIVTLRSLFEAAGRDPDTCRIVPFGVIPTEEKLDYLARAGVTEAVLRIPALDRAQAFQTLETYRKFVRA